MKIKIDDKLKSYKWLINDCINIIEEIKQTDPLDISFTLQDAGFGNKFGKLIMKDNNKIVVVKDYPYLDLSTKELFLKFENNNLSLK